MTLVIATGGIDLSVGSLMAIAGALAPLIFLGKLFPTAAASMSASRWPSSLPVLVAGAVRPVQRLADHPLPIQPIVATLILFIAGRGIAQVLTNGNLQVFKKPEFQFIGLGRVFGIPFQVIIMAVIVVVAAWVAAAHGLRPADPGDRRQRGGGAARRRAGRASSARSM